MIAIHTHTHAHTNLQPWLHMAQDSTAKCQGYSKTGFLLAERSHFHTLENKTVLLSFPVKTADLALSLTKTAYLVDVAFDNISTFPSEV